MSEAAGFDQRIGTEVDTRGRYMLSMVGGVSAADADGDGWTDLFVADFGPNLLYLNQRNGTFREVAGSLGVAGDSPSSAGLFLDHDGDGDPDLFVANHGARSRLYENTGNGTFRDATEEAGIEAESWSYGAAAADIEGDGDLDLSVLNYDDLKAGVGPGSYDNATNGLRDLLYVNQGDGTFQEEARVRGIDATRYTLSHAWADYDEDGDPDLYMNVDFGRDILYENDGNGTFRDVTRSVGIRTDENGMGAVWTDVDDDLDLDLFSTNIHVPHAEGIDHFEGNDLFLQSGNGTFRDAAAEAGIHAGGWGWDSAWTDLDHDGDVDAYQANGMVTRSGDDLYYDTRFRVTDERPRATPETVPLAPYGDDRWISIEVPAGADISRTNGSIGARQVDRLWLNEDGGSFRNISAEVGVTRWGDSRGVAALDHDRDGDLDIARTAYRRSLRLYENQAVETATPEDPRHWLQVELAGRASNRDAVGARVVAVAGNLTALRTVEAGEGFLSQDPTSVHFGLGSHETVDELRVSWPSGETATFEDLEADQRVQVTEPDRLGTGIWS